MYMNQKNRILIIFERIRVILMMLLLIVFSCKITFGSENITIETKNDNFFENVISVTLFLLDSDLQKIIADDFAHVVNESKFTLQVNSEEPIEQNIANLSNLNDSNRYQQIVHTTADIMNSTFEKIRNKNIVKNVNFVKHPMKFLVVANDFANFKAAIIGFTFSTFFLLLRNFIISSTLFTKRLDASFCM